MLAWAGDGPWIDASDIVTTPMTMADVIALADLDGDPEVISDEEHKMIALLAQMLGTSPMQN